MKKIISYNLNGIRSALSKGLNEWLAAEAPDLICFQETKAQDGQFDVDEFSAMGYHHYHFPAQKKGYSGVAVFTKTKPLEVSYGIGNAFFDAEGRVITCRFENFTHICAYFPSGTSGDERQDLKMQFLDLMKAYIDELRKTSPKILISGDFNIAHHPIDINHPSKHVKMSGFLPEERQWLSNFLSCGFIDTFRKFDQSAEKYSWWSYRAGSRGKNLGWRIDYHLASSEMDTMVVGAGILSDAVHSDHCPIVVVIND